MQGSLVTQLATAWAQAIRGAVADCEEMVASDRARRLRTTVSAFAATCVWVAWAWLAVLLLYLLVTPLVDAPALVLTAQIESREAVFAVLALALAGPVAVAGLAWSLFFVHRILVDLVISRMPRAFKPLASPSVVLAGLAVLWVNRGTLHGEYRWLYHEVGNVLQVAAQFSPVVAR